MNPFDWKAALLAKHAQHVVMIHFPIALLIAGVVFDVLACLRKSHTLAAAARYNLYAALLTCPLAVATGLLAWQWQLEGAKIKGNLLLHILFAISSIAATALLGWLHAKSQTFPSLLRLFVGLGAIILITITGHIGGFLSGVEAP